MKTVNKYIVYIYCIVCFFQAKFLLIPLPGFQLSLGRICFAYFLVMLLFTTFRSRTITITNIYSHKFLYFWVAHQTITLFPGIYYGFSGWVLLTYLLLLILVVCLFLDKTVTTWSMFYRIVVLLFIGISIQALLGLYEHITGSYHFTSLHDLYTTHPFFLQKKYPVAMQENPNDFALLMFVGIEASAIIIMVYRNKFLRFTAAGMALIEVYVLICADSRSVLLGLLISILYFIIFRVVTLHKRKMSKTALLLLGTAVFAAALFMVFKMGDLLIFLAKNLNFNLHHGSESERIRRLIEGFNCVIRTLGIGVGSQGYVTWHFFLGEILFNCGVLVFVGFLIFCVKLFKNLSLADSLSDKGIAFVSQIARAGMIGFSVASLGPSSTLRLEWLGLFFAVYIIMEKLVLRETEIQAAEAESSQQIEE